VSNSNLCVRHVRFDDCSVVCLQVKAGFSERDFGVEFAKRL